MSELTTATHGFDDPEENEGDLERQRELWPVKESVKVQIDELMGQTL